MTIAADLVSAVSWKGVAVSMIMGAGTAGAYIFYIEAFRAVGSPSMSLAYASRLVMNPYFVLAVFMSGSSIFARPFLYESLGAQRGYFVMAGIGAVVATSVIVAVFRERMDNLQYVGALMAICGSVLVARG